VGPEKLDQFEAERGRLFGLAYRMLGEASEAEDVVQDAYLRWQRSGSVDVPAAWLTTVVTNLCLDRLTSARSRRELYVGPWLPEPVFTDTGELGPLESVEQRDSVSFAVLMLLERLTPPERATFVLHTAFGYSHREIARILELEDAHVRQLYRRAREHVGDPRRRFTANPEHRRKIVERFLAATLDGDVADLERLLADDVVSWADGGGEAPAARRQLIGRDEVIRVLAALGRHQWAAHMAFAIHVVNGEPGIVMHEGGVLRAILAPEVVAERVVAVRAFVNPDKLSFAARQRM
jgi:RNA polymerase sigma factor (sigma-70 family)